MITIETRPIRLAAVQWHKPGDCPELVSTYKHGAEVRYGVHSATAGMQRVTEGDWIVIGNSSSRVYSPGEFNLKFRIIEQEGNQP